MTEPDLFAKPTPATAQETRRCRRCTATPGRYVTEAFTGSSTGTRYPETSQPCFCCNGTPDMPRPDFKALVIQCRGRKGLKSSRPQGREAYYLWRMARFHGGADVTMPMGAMTDMRDHPWLPEFDTLADLIAKRAFGTTMAAAHRWGMALGYVRNPVLGLPDSAYPCGRVADGNKPLEEMAEMI